MIWTLKKYDDLALNELYDILRLRAEVFVVEQNCPYNDLDGRDQASFHLQGRDEKGQLVASTRLVPRGVSYENYASIGRVVTSPTARGTGAGRELMRVSIEKCAELFEGERVKIGAQAYLLKFYESLGFRSTGEEYLEDGIPHVAMTLEK